MKKNMILLVVILLLLASSAFAGEKLYPLFDIKALGKQEVVIKSWPWVNKTHQPLTLKNIFEDVKDECVRIMNKEKCESEKLRYTLLIFDNTINIRIFKVK